MANELDEYLSTPDALRQTCDAEGRLLKPGDVVSGLRVVAFLGRGATSEVWRVHDDALNRDLALKILVKTPLQKFVKNGHSERVVSVSGRA